MSLSCLPQSTNFSKRFKEGKVRIPDRGGMGWKRSGTTEKKEDKMKG